LLAADCYFLAAACGQFRLEAHRSVAGIRRVHRHAIDHQKIAFQRQQNAPHVC